MGEDCQKKSCSGLKRALLCWILTFLCFSLNSRSDPDSLWSIWIDRSVDDTVRAGALEDYIIDGSFNYNPDSAIILTEALIDFTESNDNDRGLADALNLYGYILFRMGNFPEAMAAYERGLKVADKSNYLRAEANILMRTGYIFHDNGDVITALSYYSRSLKLFERLNDKSGMAGIYNEFGSIYREREQYDKSLEYYEKGLEINMEFDPPVNSPAILMNMSDVYLNLKDYEKAIAYYTRGLAMYEDRKDKLGIATGLGGLGDVYAAMGEDEKALDFMRRSLSISEEINDAQGEIYVLLGIADIMLGRNQYTDAIRNAEMALDHAVRLEDFRSQRDCYALLYNAHKEAGNHEKAIFYGDLELLLNDSLRAEETALEIQQMEFAQKFLADSLRQVEKDRKVQLAHEEEVRKKDRNRNIAVVSGVFFLLLAGGFYSRWRYVNKSRAIIQKEKDRSESLLLNILPEEIAEELKLKGEASARDFDLVSILFTDFKDFTKQSENLSAQELLEEINECFKKFDHICEKYGIEKIKTIGDSFMAAGGLPISSGESVKNTVLAGLEMQKFISNRIEDKKQRDELFFEMRLGIHTGPVVAGIVGVKKFQYDVWGDTVNTASRMESNGVVGKVNISQGTYEILKGDPDFIFDSRGKIEVKGKRKLEMWFVRKKSTV